MSEEHSRKITSSKAWNDAAAPNRAPLEVAFCEWPSGKCEKVEIVGPGSPGRIKVQFIGFLMGRSRLISSEVDEGWLYRKRS